MDYRLKCERKNLKFFLDKNYTRLYDLGVGIFFKTPDFIKKWLISMKIKNFCSLKDTISENKITIHKLKKVICNTYNQ